MSDSRIGEYLLPNRAAAARDRLMALAALFDDWTARHLSALGVGPGWRCWEVGAGGDSMPRWLAAQVGPSGRVLATDIEPSEARHPASGVMEVREHDVARDPPPAERFDVVHARLVLVHVVDRDRALRHMVEALRPGGWLVVEDADPMLQPLSCLDPQDPDEELANSLRNGFRSLLASRGVDLAYGRRLPRLLRQAGLNDVAADAYFPVSQPACRQLEVATVTLIRDELERHGLASPADIDRHLANVAAGRLDLAQPPLITVWGRRDP